MAVRPRVPAISRLRTGRQWLRSRGPVALAAALLLEVSSATTVNGSGTRGLLRAALLVVALFGVLIAAAVDSLVTSAALALVRGQLAVAQWTRVTVLGLPAPLDLASAVLLDRSGRPLRGAARSARIKSLQREHAQQTYARSVRGRLEVALAELSRLSRPYARRVARVGLAIESRVLAARATAIAVTARAAGWTKPRAERAFAAARTRAVVLWSLARARVEPLTVRALASARSLGAGLRQQFSVFAPVVRDTTLIALGRSRAVLVAIPVPAVPVPSMSVRTLRIVSSTLLLSFVFATVIGTTGLVATRGSVALGASTTLAIISGDVSVMGPGTSEFRPAVDGDILQAGSTIKTGPETYAVLTYFEGSTVSIDPETVLTIEALQANPDGSTVIGMRQDIGQTWHSVTKLLTAGSKYEVRTPTATATVRGTLFLVGVQQSNDLGLPETLIETTEGAVAAEREPTPEDPEGEEIIVPAGFQVKATQSTPIPPPVPAPEPERKVTVTVEASNSVVVDPQGRANGEVNGRIVVQTPGATVERVDGRLVVTLPNTTDGKISTVIQPERREEASEDEDDEEEPERPRRRVRVETVVEERGRGESRSEETVEAGDDATGVTGVEVTKSAGDSAPPEVRRLDQEEKKDAPPIKVSQVPDEEVVALTIREERRADERGEGSEERDDEGNGDREGNSGDGDGNRGNGDGNGQDGDDRDDEDGEGDDRDDEGSDEGAAPRGIVNSIVTLTLPPLSAEEIARRERQQREAAERERRENERREERRREEDRKKVEELRRQEEQARAQAERIGGERLQEEGRRSDRRGDEERRRDEDRREEARQGNAPAAPVGLLQQVLRAIAPTDAGTRRDEDARVDELRKAEEQAKKAAEKAAEELRRAEQRLREESIKAEEEKRKEAEKRAEELRKAEERAKQDEARKLEELRRIEEKAREQAAKLADSQRREAEKRLEQFREDEERKRREETKRLEDQRRAEERAREEAERNLRELRRQEEQAKERESERERERQRERDGEDERRRNRGGFVPNVELKPAPGFGSRSVDEKDRSKQQLELKEQRAAEREKRNS